MKHALLSSTSLATATVAPTLALASSRPSTTTPLAVRPASALIAASVAGLMATATPADAAYIYTVNGIKAGTPILSGSTVTGYTEETLYLGVGTGGLSTSPSPTVGYLLISPSATASTYTTTMSIARGDVTKNVLIALSPISTTAGWGATTNVGTINNPTPSLVSTFTYSPSATMTRGNSVTNTFQILGELSGGGSGNPIDKTNITLISNWVAPVQSTSATATQLYVLPGKSTNGSVTITNIGDGNLAAPTGTNLGTAGSPYNLQGTVTSATSGAGFTLAPTTPATLNLTDTKGPANAASSSTTFTTTYTGTTRGASATANLTATFTNGSTANNNAGGQTASYTFTGKTVAPVASLTSTTTEIRVGTTGSLALTVTNTGDGNLAGTGAAFNLTGKVGSTAGAITGAGGTLNGATGLQDSNFGGGATTSQTFTFNYAPTARGTASTSVAVSLDNGTNTSNAGGTINATLTAKAVGPVYESKFTTNGATTTTTLASNGPGTGTAPNVEVYGGTILFGDQVGGLSLQNLLISNISDDNAGPALTDLNLTSISIVGSSEYQFSLSGFASGGTGGGTVGFVDSTTTSFTLNNTKNLGDNTGTIAIQFVSKVGENGLGQLRITTDENAALNGPGTIYVYDLRFTVPEPGTIMVFGAGLLGLAISRRSRRGQAEAVRLTAAAEAT